MKYLWYLTLTLVLSVHGSYLHAQRNTKSVSVNFTTIDVPGAGYTGIFGINSTGDMVGNYGQDTNGDSHGFMYSGGTFTYFDYPGQNVTVPTGINDSNLIVGYAGTSSVLSFFYDGTSFTSFQDGSNSATYGNGLNNAGDVVGAAGTPGATRGFEMRSGSYKNLLVPGNYVYVRGSGINNLGAIVGWTDFDGFVCHSVSKCKVIDYPGASQTAALGVNDAGVIAGWYGSSSCVCAFASKNGKFISFGFPGAAFTGAAGINNYGQIVGQYTFDYQVWHGFVTNPITSADFQ